MSGRGWRCRRRCRRRGGRGNRRGQSWHSRNQPLMSRSARRCGRGRAGWRGGRTRRLLPGSRRWRGRRQGMRPGSRGESQVNFRRRGAVHLNGRVQQERRRQEERHPREGSQHAAPAAATHWLPGRANKRASRASVETEFPYAPCPPAETTTAAGPRLPEGSAKRIPAMGKDQVHAAGLGICHNSNGSVDHHAMPQVCARSGRQDRCPVSRRTSGLFTCTSPEGSALLNVP